MTKAEALTFFSALFGGKKNIPGDGYGEDNLIRYGLGWSVVTDQDLATYDRAVLTDLVCLAHDYAYRAEITVAKGAPSSLQIVVWKRRRGGDQGQHHPTLDQAVQAHRRRFGPPADAPESRNVHD